MKTLQIDLDRFTRELARASFNAHEGRVVLLADVYEAISSLQCDTEACNNECRYDSGFCSLCVMRFNDSKGKRITHPEPE